MNKITLQDIDNEIFEKYPRSTTNIKLSMLKEGDSLFLVMRPEESDNGEGFFIEEHIIESVMHNEDGAIIKDTDGTVIKILCTSTTVWTNGFGYVDNNALEIRRPFVVYGAASNFYASTRKLKDLLEEYNRRVAKQIEDLGRQMNELGNRYIDITCFEKFNG